MFALSNFPTAQTQTQTIGSIPKDVFPGIPTPEGLTIVGGITGAYGGKVTAEALFYAAAEGSVPDVAAYAALLTRAGWTSQFPASPFAARGFPQNLCKPNMPALTVLAAGRYIVVRAAINGPCPLAHMPGALPGVTQPKMSIAPYPHFTAPDGSSFVGFSKATFNGNSHVTATGVTSALSPDALLGDFSKQMTAAGWAAKNAVTAGGDSAVFSIRDKDGIDWIAVLTVVTIANGTDIFTASAFKTTETGTSHVTAAR